MKNLFVGNMSFDTTENELRALFEQYGEVERVNVVTDRDTGRARGFAFVEMASDEAAASAITALNGREVNGRALNVNEARPKPEGGRGGGGRGGSRDNYRGGGGGGGFGRQPRDRRW
jgi:RNA recognition motif-containing protein